MMLWEQRGGCDGETRHKDYEIARRFGKECGSWRQFFRCTGVREAALRLFGFSYTMNYDILGREMKIEVIKIKEKSRKRGLGNDVINQENGILMGKKDRRDRAPPRCLNARV